MMMDDEELNKLRQAALNSLKDNKSDNFTNVSSSSSSNTREARVRSQVTSLQNNNGLMRIPPVHNSPLLPSPPVTVQQSKPCKSNISPYNGDFVSSKSQSQVNNGQRYGGSPGSPIRHHSQPTQSTQQSSAVHSQQPHHSQQQSSSQSSQSSGRHHHMPPVHNQGYSAGQNSFFRPSGGPPPPSPQHGGHHPMNSMSPHMPGLPVPYGHQGAPPPPPHLGHPAYRSPYPQAPHHAPPPPPPPGLTHLPPGSFHPMHAPSSFHPPAGYTPLHFAKRPSGPRHGFHNFYPNSFNHNVNSGPNHMHSSNDHSPPHLQTPPRLQPPHPLPPGLNGMHGAPSSVKMPLNDPIHRSNFNEARNASHSGLRRKPYDGSTSNRSSSHNHNNNNSDDQSSRNGSSSSNQSSNQRDGHNSPCFKDSSGRSSSKVDENDSNSPKHRGPERFSRIERSDSESDEDDRLDGLLEDLNDEAEGDSAEKSQDSLYNTNSGSFTNPLLDTENADDESDQVENEDEPSDEDNVCKLKESDDHESHDESIKHHAKKARLV